jgi:hypothetical protein
MTGNLAENLNAEEFFLEYIKEHIIDLLEMVDYKPNGPEKDKKSVDVEIVSSIDEIPKSKRALQVSIIPVESSDSSLASFRNPEFVGTYFELIVIVSGKKRKTAEEIAGIIWVLLDIANKFEVKDENENQIGFIALHPSSFEECTNDLAEEIAKGKSWWFFNLAAEVYMKK